MSLGYASFSDSAAQELLPMHEKEEQSGFEYRLHDSQQKNQNHSCSTFWVLKERFSGIPPQDEISKKKETIHKWQVLTMVLALTAVFLGFWGYNAQNRVVTIEVKNVTTFHLPKLTLCIPFGPGTELRYMAHTFIFKEYNLTDVRQPGDFNSTTDIHPYCNSTGFGDNTCGDFVEYEGACLSIGVNNSTFPWNLTTPGQTVLAFTLIYPKSSYLARDLVLPFFGWFTNCTVGKGGEKSNNSECTKKRYKIFEDRIQNPSILYQVYPNQLTLAEVHKQVHVDQHGVRNELYPTSFVNFPFSIWDQRHFNQFCLDPRGCDVIFFGLRSISQTVQTTYEERYLLSVVRSFGTAASLIALISGICTFIYAFFITKLIFREKHAHLNHDLRDAIIYLHKELSAVDKNRG